MMDDGNNTGKDDSGEMAGEDHLHPHHGGHHMPPLSHEYARGGGPVALPPGFRASSVTSMPGGGPGGGGQRGPGGGVAGR